MKTFFKFILYIVIWAIIAALVVAGAVLLGMTPLKGAYIAAALFGLWLLFIILRKLILRLRARRRVKALITEEDPGELSDKPVKKKRFAFFGKAAGPTLAADFNRLLRLLRKSELRKQGDPLYVLPWYVLMGPPESGKSAALESAGLPSPIFEEQLIRDRACSWRPYNHAVLIDPPGDFVEAAGGPERDEWLGLIRLLRERRDKEPLNGVVIVIGADQLLQGNENDLFEQGRICRARIEEMMKSLKVVFPVYLMVSKCNLIDGFAEWSDSLPESCRKQVMGHVRRDEDVEVKTFIQQSLEAETERIKDLMLVNPALDFRLLRLPGGLKEMKSRLTAFADGVFQENPFQETPDLRGLYFSGVLHPEAEAEDGETRQGVFLQDFFTRVLPADRNLLKIHSRAVRAENLTRRLFMGGWGAAMIIAGLLLAAVYAKNLGYLEETARNFKGAFDSAAEYSMAVNSLDGLREMVLSVEDRVSGWWVPWFGVGDEPAFIRKLKTVYTSRFRDDALEPLDEKLLSAVDKRFSAAPRAEGLAADPLYLETAWYVGMISARINMLDAYLNGADAEALKKLPPAFVNYDLFLKGDADAETVRKLNVLYIQSLLWSDNRESVEKELETFRAYLARLLKAGRQDLFWIIPLANDRVTAAVHLSDFWNGSGNLEEDVTVQSAFTVEGKAFIDDFLTRLLETDPTSQPLQAMKADFDAAYKAAYLNAWQTFARHFGSGAQTLRGSEEWAAAVELIATRDNPFFSLLDLMNEQLQPFFGDETLPEWAALVDYYQQMQTFSPEDMASESKKKGVLARVGLNLLNKLGGVGQTVSETGREAMVTRRRLSAVRSPDDRIKALEAAGKTLGEYRQALMDVAFNVDSRSVSFKAMSSFFANAGDLGAGDGPESRAYKSVRRLQSLIGKETETTQAFWDLYAGPLDVIVHYMRREAACALQRRWNDKFLVEIENVPDYKVKELIFGPEGKLWSFLEDEASPFIKRVYGKGYVPVQVLGRSLPFRPAFLSFISMGKDFKQASKDRYPVSIKALPTSANETARLQPNAVLLKMTCADKAQELNNYNFRIDKTFEWSDDCGEVSLTIEIENLTLKKVYPGADGFVSFLTDFKYGSRKFTPADFPENAADLEQLDVEYIEVQYEISGHDEIMAVQEVKPDAAPPKTIVACWPPEGNAGAEAPEIVSGEAPAAPAAAEGPCKAWTGRPEQQAEEERRVLDTVFAWVNAWSSGDAAAYLAFYAPDFSPPDGMSRADWEDLRRRRLDKEFIHIDVSQIEIDIEDCDAAAAEFMQSYKSESYQDATRKRLEFKKIDGRWRIMREGAAG